MIKGPRTTPANDGTSGRPRAGGATTREEARRLLREGKDNSAEAVYQQLEADPAGRPYAKLALAELKLQQGSLDEAAVAATEAIKLGMGTRALLLRAQAELRSGRITNARRDFEHVVKVDPANSEALAGIERTAQRP